MYVCVCKCERVCVFVIGKLRIHWIVQNILPASSYFRNPYLFFCHQRVITRSATSCVCCCSRVLVQLLKKVVSCRQQEVKPNLKITKERKKNLSGARAGERRKKRWSLPEAMWHSNQPVGCWNPFFFSSLLSPDCTRTLPPTVLERFLCQFHIGIRESDFVICFLLCKIRYGAAQHPSTSWMMETVKWLSCSKSDSYETLSPRMPLS